MSADDTSALIERLRLAIAARPKFKALPIDIDDVNAIVAALGDPAEDHMRMGYVEARILEATRDGTQRRLVLNGPTVRTSVYVDVVGLGTLREVIDGDRLRRATLDANRRKAGR